MMLITVYLVSQVAKVASLDESALSICQNYPGFHKGCKHLRLVNDNVEKMLARADNSYGYKNLIEVHSGCKDVNFRDIFGVCKNFKNLAQEYYTHLGDIHGQIVALAQPKTALSIRNSVYSGCLAGKLKNNLCNTLTDFSTQLAQEDQSELLLTPGINDVCKDRPALLICSKMKELADITFPEIDGTSGA